jgi:hypothetical protein
MPARDGTGPFGTGSVGCGLGPCSGHEQERIEDRPPGMANRRGRGFYNHYPHRGRGVRFTGDEKPMSWPQTRRNK